MRNVGEMTRYHTPMVTLIDGTHVFVHDCVYFNHAQFGTVRGVVPRFFAMVYILCGFILCGFILRTCLMKSTVKLRFSLVMSSSAAHLNIQLIVLSPMTALSFTIL